MPDTDLSTDVDARLWYDAGALNEDFEGDSVALGVERTDRDEVALHLFIDGRGSLCSYYFTREQAVDLATRLLASSRLR